MKIDKPTADQNKETLKKLIKGQRNEITQRTQEIKNIQNIYDKKVDDERLIGERKLLDVHDRNKAEFIMATQGKEEKLEAIKKDFVDTRDRLNHETELLHKNQKDKIQFMNTEHSMKASDIFDRSREELLDVNLKTNNLVSDAQKKAETEIQRSNHKAKLTVDKVAFENDQKIIQAQSGQESQLKQAQDKYQLQVRRTEGQHKALLADQTLRNDIDFKGRQRIFEDRKEVQEKHYNELVRSSKVAFEQKYSSMIEQHNQVLDRLKAKFETDLNETAKSFSKQYQAKADRASDPFYGLKTLAPTVREDEEAYYIDIKTQKHEKENFNLTANKRRVKLTFNRRSKERVDGQQGEVSTSNRSESILKEFKVAEIVDDRNLKVSYKDGVLSYRLPKA